MIDLDLARQKLPLPALMQALGLGAHAKQKALCPWHEDKNASFSVHQNGNGRWWYKCHAGCVENGDEIALIRKVRGVDAAQAIRIFGELAGVSDDKNLGSGPLSRSDSSSSCVTGIGTTPESAPARVTNSQPAQLIPLTEQQIVELANWRGYSEHFVRRIAAAGVIGTFENKIAFPTEGGLHYRMPKDDGWRYTTGAKPSLFVFGSLDLGGVEIHVFESQWDALAVADALDLPEARYIATRGASNARLAIEALDSYTGTVVLWQQNDGPGAKWADAIGTALGNVATVTTPAEYADANAWRRDFLRPDVVGEMRAAYADALKDLPAVPVLAESTNGDSKITLSGASPQDIGGEALGSTIKPVQSAEGTKVPEQVAVADSSDGGQSLLSGGERGCLLRYIRHTPPVRGVHTLAPAAQSLSQTLDAIVGFLARYVVFAQPEQAITVALWIAHTWVYSSFRWTPYLHIVSPARECGKSTLLSCLNLLCRAPWQVVAPSPAAIYTKIEEHRPTVLIDEAHKIFDNKNQSERNQTLQSILEAGFEAGLTVPRCPNGKLVESDIFSPKAIAGIGGMPDTIESRSISIHLVRCSVDAGIQEIDDEDALDDAQPIKAALKQWAAESSEGFKRAKPERPAKLKARQRNICKPLLSIAEAASDEWKSQAQASLVALFSKAQEMGDSETLLAAIRAIFHSKGRSTLTVIELLEALISTETAGAVWVGWWERDFKNGQTHKPAQKLAELLKPYGIAARTMTLNNEETTGYRRIDLEDTWKLYLPELTFETGDLI